MTIGLVRFAEPLALIALLFVPLLAGLVWFEARRRRQANARYGGSSALRLGAAPARRAVQGTLLVAAVALLIIAAARPQWGHQETEAEQRGIDVAVVLDVSRSMTATDVAPSRARAAAAGLRDMLGHLDGNRVALVTFAGTAFTRSPLTVDLPALANLVDRAQNDSPLVQAGTDLRVAIESAVLLLSVTDRAQTQVIVLISDGEDLGADVQSAIERANQQGIAIHTVFAATENPTALPASSGGTDLTRGDPRNLTAIARGTGGTTRDVRGMAGLAVDFRRLQQTQFQTAQTRASRDHFSWFIGGALVLLLTQAALPTSSESRLLPRVRMPRFGRSRRAAAGVALSAIVVMLTGCVAVSGTEAYRRVEAGNGLYSAGQFDRALQEYTAAAGLDPNDLAIQYNLANALYRLGRYEETLSTIDAALAKNPE
ncbi:MAG: VWA domain-containing protein, partial [Chloroflexi bacterium]